MPIHFIRNTDEDSKVLGNNHANRSYCRTSRLNYSFDVTKLPFIKIPSKPGIVALIAVIRILRY